MQAHASPTSGASSRSSTAGRCVQRPAVRTARGVALHAVTEAAAIRRLATERPQCTERSAAVQLLRTAGTQKNTEPELVEGAICTLEQLSQKDGRPIIEGGATVEGEWRLVFSTATTMRFLQYIPVIEDLHMHLASKRIDLASELGPFRFTFKGSIKSWDEQAAKMEFEFSQLVVKLFGNQIYQRPITPKPKSYTYFYVGPDVGAVRSSGSNAASGGNVTLLIRKP